MRQRVSCLCVAILAAWATSSSAADRVTYAFGGPAHRPVDTIVYIDQTAKRECPLPRVRDPNRRPELFGERPWPESPPAEACATVEIRSTRPFLQEPVPGTLPVLRGQSPFETLQAEETRPHGQEPAAPVRYAPRDGAPVWKRPANEHETPTGSPFDEMLIAS